MILDNKKHQMFVIDTKLIIWEEDGWYQQEPKGAVWHTMKPQNRVSWALSQAPITHKTKAQKIKGSYHEGVGTIYYQVMDEMSLVSANRFVLHMMLSVSKLKPWAAMRSFCWTAFPDWPSLTQGSHHTWGQQVQKLQQTFPVSSACVWSFQMDPLRPAGFSFFSISHLT